MATDIPVPWLLSFLSTLLLLLGRPILPESLSQASAAKLAIAAAAVNFGSWGIWKAFIYPTWFNPLRQIPQPKGGNIPLIRHSGAAFKRPAGANFLQFIKEVPNEGMIRIPGLLNSQNLLLTDPKSLAEVLVHKPYDYQKPRPIRNFLRIILGDGLVVVEGDEHRFQRKNLMPAFSFGHIKELYPIFWSKSILLRRRISAEIHYLTDQGKSSELEINHWAMKITMDIIGVAGLGREFNTIENSDDPLTKNYEEITDPSPEKILFFASNILLPPWLMSILPWKLNERLKVTTGALRDIYHQLVRDKKELLKIQGEENVDILSLLIKTNDFSDGQLVDQLLTFLAAGHETTSAAFTWAAYLLTAYPDVQSRLREEVRAHMPSPLTATEGVDLAGSLESLPYLNAVCNEILRLYPPVPTTIRTAVRDTTINGQVVPEGTRVYVSPWAINRSPHLWGSDAGEFCPDRWIDHDTGRANNTGGVKSNYSILTFIHGPRSCIGEKFAKAELKALVAVFCGTFQMDLADPTEIPTPAGAITAKPQNGMRLRLKVVEGW